MYVQKRRGLGDWAGDRAALAEPLNAGAITNDQYWREAYRLDLAYGRITQAQYNALMAKPDWPQTVPACGSRFTAFAQNNPDAFAALVSRWSDLPGLKYPSCPVMAKVNEEVNSTSEAAGTAVSTTNAPPSIAIQVPQVVTDAWGKVTSVGSSVAAVAQGTLFGYPLWAVVGVGALVAWFAFFSKDAGLE